MSEQSTPAKKEAASKEQRLRHWEEGCRAKCCHFGGNKNIFLTTAWKKCRRHRIRTCLAASRLFPGAGGGRGGVARQRLL